MRQGTKHKIDLLTCSPVEAIQLLYPVVHDVVTKIVMPIAQDSHGQRKGGYFAFWRKLQNSVVKIALPVIGFAVCEPSENKVCDYAEDANKKCFHLTQNVNAVSSWYLKKQFETIYGGGISMKNSLYFAFSGFSEHDDEMVSVLTAHRLGVLTKEERKKIIDISKNYLLRCYCTNRKEADL